MSALRSKRAEMAATVVPLEQRLIWQRADLTHLEATMRLFGPEIRPTQIRPRQRRARGAWFRHGECLRLSTSDRPACRGSAASVAAGTRFLRFARTYARPSPG